MAQAGLDAEGTEAVFSSGCGLELVVTVLPPQYGAALAGEAAQTPPPCRTELVLSIVDHGQFSPAIRFRGTKDMWRFGSMVCVEEQAEIPAGGPATRLVARVPRLPRGARRAAIILRIEWSAQNYATCPAFAEPSLRMVRAD